MKQRWLFCYSSQSCVVTILFLCKGGMELKSQEAALRKNPDMIVATPGRLVDFLHNAPSFGLQYIEILVLDEADRYVHVLNIRGMK